MMIELILDNVLIGLLLIACATLVYLYFKDKTKDDIRKDVYQLIIKAERRFKYGENTQKFEYVVQLAHSLLPAWLQAIITAPLLQKVFKKIIQELFNEIKDVLDDGKRNGSSKEQGEDL